MATDQDEIRKYLRRSDEKLDRLLKCVAMPTALATAKEPAPGQKADRLSELLDAFEVLSPEERRRDIERANEYLRIHGIEAAVRLKAAQPPQKEATCPS